MTGGKAHRFSIAVAVATALVVAACSTTRTPPSGPGIHWMGHEEGWPTAELTGVLTIDGDCLFVTSAETGDVYSLVLYSRIDTSAGVVDSETHVEIPNGATVVLDGGEIPARNVDKDAFSPSPECLTGHYWIAHSLQLMSP